MDWGGVINIPPKFLKWVKIKGDTEENDDSGGSSSDVFFVPATIQPKYFVNDEDTEPIEIKNYTLGNLGTKFLYNKEDIISLGVNEENLNNLNIIGIIDAYSDFNSNNGDNGYVIQSSAFNEKIILKEFVKFSSSAIIYNNNNNSYLYKISNDIFMIFQNTGGGFS